MLIKVSPIKGVMRFGKKGTLLPLYMGPFPIMERIGSITYQLGLPDHL